MKTFEQFKMKYKDGDHVIVDMTNYRKHENPEIAKIQVNDSDSVMITYRFIFLDGTALGSDDEIVRDATPEEIEEFELTFQTNKYNI